MSSSRLSGAEQALVAYAVALCLGGLRGEARGTVLMRLRSCSDALRMSIDPEGPVYAVHMMAMRLLDDDRPTRQQALAAALTRFFLDRGQAIDVRMAVA